MTNPQSVPNSFYQYSNISQATTLPLSRNPSVLGLSPTPTLTARNQTSVRPPIPPRSASTRAFGTGNPSVLNNILSGSNQINQPQRVEEEPTPREGVIEAIISSFDRISRDGEPQQDPSLRDGIVESLLAAFKD